MFAVVKVGEYPFQVESSDLIAYGLIPEFVGRFPILVNLSALTEDQLVQVNYFFLLYPTCASNSVICCYQSWFSALIQVQIVQLIIACCFLSKCFLCHYFLICY